MGFDDILRLSGLSQKEFAERYHVPFSTVNRWVNGGKQPSYVLALLERFVREDAMGDNEIPWVYGIGIKRIIESSHMSIKDFAVKYGISEPLLRNWLSAKKTKWVYSLPARKGGKRGHEKGVIMRYLRELYRMLSSLAKRKMYWAKEAKRLKKEFADIPDEPICVEQI